MTDSIPNMSAEGTSKWGNSEMIDLEVHQYLHAADECLAVGASGTVTSITLAVDENENPIGFRPQNGMLSISVAKQTKDMELLLRKTNEMSHPIRIFIFLLGAARFIDLGFMEIKRERLHSFDLCYIFSVG